MVKRVPSAKLLVLLAALLTAAGGCELRSDSKPPAPEPGSDGTSQGHAAGGDASEVSLKQLVDSMSLEEKIGQMVVAGMNGTSAGTDIRRLIAQRHVGGVILYENNVGSVSTTTALSNELKAANAAAKLPLLLSADQEGGRVSRLPKELAAFPSARDVGSSGDEQYAYAIGAATGRTMKAVGWNTAYAPVLDIHTNPSNPVIGPRAFGTTADTVSRIGLQELQGLRSEGVIGVVKHFPGHGDTSVDSHKGLPVVEHDIERLRKVEFVPFAAAIRQGVQAVMVGHLLMKKLDAGAPASMSKQLITGYLRGELQFEGVVITDDMTMAAVRNTAELGAAAVRSVNAGADIVLVGHQTRNVDTVLDALVEAARAGTISSEAVDRSVYRIAKLKADAKLNDAATRAADPAMLNKEIRNAVSQIKTKK
ncbi:beta-N-acetylhexosaminidase [Paenibacillus chartarius]|uniref:beta-N-acetylhexosaminidase n=1 Tax=Paenibacillus chartarius TaxID=747481 RepID=A0ABV6DQU6_9BACL